VRKAIELAKEWGTGTVVVRNSNHYGHSGFWASVPVRHNMIGFNSRALTCPVRMTSTNTFWS